MKISLYKDRTMFECVEATFDFLRANRRIWLRSALLLLLPICIVVALVFFSSLDEDQMPKDLSFWFDYFFSRLEEHPAVLMIAAYVGITMVLVHVFSLVMANLDYEDGVGGCSLSDLKPYFIRTLKRSWYLPFTFVLAIIIVNIAPFLTLLVLVVLVPLALMPSYRLVERLGVVESMTVALKKGFSVWFHLLINIVLMSLLGLYVFLFLWIPTTILSLVIETFSVKQISEWETLLVLGLGFVFTAVALFGILVVMSLVVLTCAFLYGSLSERVDAASVDNEVAHFEQL